ncbi:acrB/AcrD/AcrF family protein, partial [Vibrio parahaemolyticus AQ3810]
VVYLRSP